MDGDAHIRREFEAYFGAGADEALRSLAAFAETTEGECRLACIERGYHLNGRIFERATAVIVHSPWCVEQVRSRCPAHLDKTAVVALGATAVDPSAGAVQGDPRPVRDAAGRPDHRQPRD